MNNIVIQARNLRKVYRLYSEPRFRLIGLLGLLPSGSRRYTERAALDGVDLDIRRGEKLAIIGRNGAGKSTLLKLISRVIHPTQGTIDIRVKTQALLQIGTGFHPDFTGRENVYSYLSHLGCQGKEADHLVREIIEFAEIEDYIDQPVKTYSTGMGMRLMFATSTAIVPEVLVIDEVLGVGDAYFAQKSFERISELAKGKGTTVLLVTHDVYSAASLCDRIIWLEQGQVLMDGDPKTVADRYEASIRDQEEQRLRSKRLAVIQENLDSSITEDETRGVDQFKTLMDETVKSTIDELSDGGAVSTVFFGQLRCVGNVPIDTPLPVQRISFFRKDKLIGEIRPGDMAESDFMSLLLDANEGNWSDAEISDGRKVRRFLPWGSIFHRAPFTIRSEAIMKALDENSLRAEIEFKDTAKLECYIELLYSNGNRRARGDIANTGSGEWTLRQMAIRPNARIETTRPAFNRYGTQAMRIIDFAFLDRDGNEQHHFETGSFMCIRLHYKIEISDFKEKPLIMLAFMKEGTARSHRLVLDDTVFDSKEGREGILEVVTDPVLLSEGEYLVNVMVMRAGSYGRVERNIFFTINDKVLDAHSRAYQLKIVSKDDGPLTHNTVFVHPAKWMKDGIPCGSSGIPEH